MEKESRLKKILEILEKESSPVSGSKIAKLLGVTRQVVVQDVAVLKSRSFNIISTARGYIFNAKRPSFTRLFAVKHSKAEIYKELSLIVENGGEIIDIIIEHPVYGELKGNLNIRTAEDIKIFVSAMETANAEPLLTISKGVHLHTVGATSEEALNKIEEMLRKEGMLIPAETGKSSGIRK